MPILKADVKAPVLPQERLHLVPELGEVIIRPLLLSERLGLWRRSVAYGYTDPYTYTAGLLACAVVDANHEPIFSVEEWEIWGALNMRSALQLFEQAWALSGLNDDSDPAREKKSDAGNAPGDALGGDTPGNGASVEAGAHA